MILVNFKSKAQLPNILDLFFKYIYVGSESPPFHAKVSGLKTSRPKIIDLLFLLFFNRNTI